MLLQDARISQIIFLSLFLFLGLSTRDWTLRPDLILVAIASCLLTQWLLSCFVPFVKSKIRSYQIPKLGVKEVKSRVQLFELTCLRSAAITALGLCLLLRCNDYTTMAIAGSLAIASKFLFRHKNKHFFNPANFGIIAALILTQDAWVSPGQWGTDWWYLLLFFCTGGTILKQVGRWDTSIAFLVAYTLLEGLRNYWLGWSWDVLQHELMSGSLLLFAFFMLTDPRSIPNATISRIIWAVAIAFLTFILRNQFYLSTAVFWALFFLSPLTIWLDTIWSAPKFEWLKTINKRLPNQSFTTS
ncbi:RnfABCDGE type electron transport complex subunit D [Oscillatoria salina]|uniref:RnfABCDGE type electron transport complex subunit D n=1 Tax=Oscillatoria salina TaxID=331517 RepID=UPI001CCB067A|nr:RnfABCDGE type electron transport complex subunit D [Oscillatoria salina]MBZ8181626.1 Na+-transporting NADH:ubiquinone oxidoreductase, subunit NqrB [Oscillatoria salina IIICB1]